MKTLNSLSNHVSGLSTKTVQTSTHRFRVVMSGFGEGKVASEHSKSFLSNPLSFSTGGSYPHSDFTASVSNSQSPLSIEFGNIFVGNNLGTKRVYNLHQLFSENKFGFDPNGKGNSDQNRTDQQFPSDLKSVVIYSKTVTSKKTYKYDGNTSPHKITSGTKSFIHTPIIAGESE